jgi:hypothetical protein
MKPVIIHLLTHKVYKNKKIKLKNQIELDDLLIITVILIYNKLIKNPKHKKDSETKNRV